MEIKKQGMVKLPWATESGGRKRMELMVGDVWDTLLSVDRLETEGYDTYLTKNTPRMIDRKTGENIKIHRKGGRSLSKCGVNTKKGV